MDPKKLVSHAGLPLALAAAFSAPCAAQPAPTLHEVRVRATRFAESAASLPLGVSVITADEIRASGATTVNEAVGRLLGVPARQDLFNGGDATLDLRGFGPTADLNQVVVLDGIRLSEDDLSVPRMAALPIDSIERIEVLRGSGAVLYGEGATGGVIVITTKAGAGRQQPAGATAYAATGSYGLRELRAGGSIAAGGFGLDVHAQKRRHGGWRANSRSDTEAASVTGQWSNDWLRGGLRLAHDDLDARLPGELSAAQYAADPRQTTKPNDFASVANDRATLFAQAELGPWSLALEAGRRDKELRSFNTTSFGTYRFDYDVDASQYSVRARRDASWRGLDDIVVLGADVTDWRRVILGGFASTASQHAVALYAKNDVVLAGGTRFSLGGRTERIRKDNSVPPPSAFSDRQHAWELGASHPFGGVTGYARIGRSYRLPNVDEFNFTSPGVNLVPQVSRDAELGWRWKHAAGSAEMRLYRSDLEHEIGFDPAAPGPWGPGVNVNFDPTRRQGVELDWTHALGRTLDLRANLAWREAKFRAGAYAGKDVPLVPRQTVALRADWTPAARHRLSGGVNWVSSQHPDFDNACRMPSYATADARYAWEFRRNAELALGVTNLFDRKFYTQAFDCAGGTTQSIYPEPGRQLTASVRMQF